MSNHNISKNMIVRFDDLCLIVTHTVRASYFNLCMCTFDSLIGGLIGGFYDMSTHVGHIDAYTVK